MGGGTWTALRVKKWKLRNDNAHLSQLLSGACKSKSVTPFSNVVAGAAVKCASRKEKVERRAVLEGVLGIKKGW